MSFNGSPKKQLNFFQSESLKHKKKGISHISFLKTIYYNFRHLPFRKAIKFPIIIGTKTKIKEFGTINLPDNCYPGMLSIGVHTIDAWEDRDDHTSFFNRGVINVSGRTIFNWGCKVFVNGGAVLNLGNRVRFGCRSRIICYKSISVGSNVRFAWEEQLFDTDFHFLYSIDKEKYYSRTEPTIIGNNVFVGNRCTIAKGTIIPDGSVISCCSKVRGDFLKEGEHLLIMGNPAIVVKRNVEMSSSYCHEIEEKISQLLEGR